MLDMELTPEEERFFKVTKIILEVVPKYLRQLFIDKWNQKYKYQQWQSDSNSGNFLFSKLPNAVKNDWRNEVYIKKLKTGNEKDWDTTTLVFAMLFSQLNLIQARRPKSQRSPPLRISEEIDTIRETRNEFIAHFSSMQCSSATFQDITSKMKSAARNIFAINAEIEINNILRSQITTKMTGQLKSQLSVEENRNHEFGKAVKDLKDDFADLKDRVKELEDNRKEAVHPLKPYTQQDIDYLKVKYRYLYQKHRIHIVDKSGRIKLEEVDIDDFAVKLKIRKDVYPMGNFRDEARKYLESFRSVTGEDIEVSRLLDDDKRVTFIRGIAGMGKTLLSKQLATLWSLGEIYNDIEMCIMFECRDINVFKTTRQGRLEKHNLLEEFVKSNFRFDLNDGMKVLFVVDGLDELFDINTKDSIIKQLLSLNAYFAAKVIITGRPHIENKLEECGEIGGLQRVEIQGLHDEQIEEYVSKFPSPKGVCVNLDNAKDSSKRFLPILHIPQMLNTFCCVASLLKEEGVRNGAELYCWTIYLLLKQHTDKENPNKRQSVSDIFHEYSKELLSLGKVCHKLLDENKLIILKKDFEALLVDCERDSEFIDSLFVDVSDNFDNKLQFKHLTLMEFLSAFHICNDRNPMEVIIGSLKNGFLEVVVFACQLISGASTEGITQEMVKANAAELQKINGSIFCHDVVKALTECELDEKTKVLVSIDIIVLFLNEHFWNKDTLLSTVRILNTDNVQTQGSVSKNWYKGIYFYIEKSKKLHTIYEYMVNICKFNDNEVRAAFEHIHVRWFQINQFETIKCVKYFGRVFGVEFSEMKLNLNAARREFDAIDYRKCTAVNMFRCELEDIETGSQTYGSNLDVVVIQECKLRSLSCLINSFHWVTSSLSSSSLSPSLSGGKQFELYGLKIQEEWWSELVTAIEKEKKSKGKLNLKLLGIWNCTPQISKDLQWRILECGLILEMDDMEIFNLLNIGHHLLAVYLLLLIVHLLIVMANVCCCE